jgi:hypothetical protein
VNEHQHSYAGQAPTLVAANAQLDKQALLCEYAARFDAQAVIETGLYNGVGSGMAVPDVAYCAIDYQFDNIARAEQLCPDGLYLWGDSGSELPKFLAGYRFRLPALFWLDAHTISQEERSPTICPVLAELDAIIHWRHATSSVVLVDDLAYFGRVHGWPTLDELYEKAGEGPWQRDEADGVLRLTPS